MPTINVNTNNVGTGINKILKIQEQMFKDALIHVLRFDFIDDYVSAFSVAYDQLLVAPYEGSMSPNDRTAPSRLKPQVMGYVRSEVQSKISVLNSRKKIISINAIEHGVFGFPSGPPKNETDALKLFYFYLVGTPQELAFVSAEYIKEWRAARNLANYNAPRTRGSGNPLGRFGLGFMVPMEEYKAVYQVATGLPSPSQARHPFSGAPPIHIFEEVERRINFNSYIEKAVVLMRKS